MNYLRRYFKKLRYKTKRHFIEVLQSKTSDKSIAWGFAIGTFIAILPTPGFSILLGFLMIAIFKKINKIAVLISMAVWNGITVIPIYWASIKLGNLLFGKSPVIYVQFELLNQLISYTLRFLFGNLIITIPISILSFYVALLITKRFRSEREPKNLKYLKK